MQGSGPHFNCTPNDLGPNSDLLDAVADQLCGGQLEVSRYQAASSDITGAWLMETDGAQVLSILWGTNPFSSCPSTTIALPSYTPVSTFNLGTCNGRRQLEVANLSTPLDLALPTTTK